MGESVFQWQRRVEFRDTDAAGIVHFSVFFTYMEEAEHAFWRHLGRSVVEHLDDCTISWPRVAARCDYRQSIRFEQVVTIDLSVQRLGEKSVTWGFHFHCDGQTIAEGSTTVVCCQFPTGDLREPVRPVPLTIPAATRDLLAPWLAGSD